MMVTMMTRPCVWCKKTAQVEVSVSGLVLMNAGVSVQDSFPELTADERELLITGTHAHCWAAIHGTEEEDV